MRSDGSFRVAAWPSCATTLSASRRIPTPIRPSAFRLSFRAACGVSDTQLTVLRPMPTVRARWGQVAASQCVVITFDDGYADNLEAARVLERYGVTATFYITAGCLAGESPFWPAEVRQLIAAIPEPQATLRVGSVQVDLDLTTMAARAAAVRQLTRVFKSHTIPVRERLREQLRLVARSPGCRASC